MTKINFFQLRNRSFFKFFFLWTYKEEQSSACLFERSIFIENQNYTNFTHT
jgi:hypothetical protein